MNFNDVNVLGNLIDTTFGKSSSRDGSYSIKCKQAGENLVLNYTMIVHFATEHALREQVIRCTDEATQRLTEYLTLLKKEFKAEAGSALNTTKSSTSDNVELISATSNSPRKIAYYRMTWVLKVA